MKIGVIGVGVVGGAVYRAFKREFDVIGYDIAGEFAKKSNYDAIVKDCEIVFICAPSPTVDGKQDPSAVIDVCKKLHDSRYQGIAVIKSTVLPGTTAFLRNLYLLNLYHNPEFLTAATPFEDFMNQKAIIIGGDVSGATKLMSAYKQVLPKAKVICYDDPAITETAKYMRNNYLTVKVTLANEFYSLCEHLGIDYNTVKDAMLSQGGIEPGHWKVPGPDGKLGYSGMCFPKDIRALTTFLKDAGLICGVLKGAEVTNQAIRPHDIYCKELP